MTLGAVLVVVADGLLAEVLGVVGASLRFSPFDSLLSFSSLRASLAGRCCSSEPFFLLLLAMPKAGLTREQQYDIHAYLDFQKRTGFCEADEPRSGGADKGEDVSEEEEDEEGDEDE